MSQAGRSKSEREDSTGAGVYRRSRKLLRFPYKPEDFPHPRYSSASSSKSLARASGLAEDLESTTEPFPGSAENITVTGPRSDESLLRAFVCRQGPDPEEEYMSSKIILHHLYKLLPTQMTASYRPNASASPEANAENNIRILQELYPSQQNLLKVRAAGIVVETVHHLKKSNAFCNPFVR